jgi:hypothetical protein
MLHTALHARLLAHLDQLQHSRLAAAATACWHAPASLHAAISCNTSAAASAAAARHAAVPFCTLHQATTRTVSALPNVIHALLKSSCMPAANTMRTQQQHGAHLPPCKLRSAPPPQSRICLQMSMLLLLLSPIQHTAARAAAAVAR